MKNSNDYCLLEISLRCNFITHQCGPLAPSTCALIVVAWTAVLVQLWGGPQPAGSDRLPTPGQSLAVLRSHSDSAPERGREWEGEREREDRVTVHNHALHGLFVRGLILPPPGSGKFIIILL